MRFCIVGSGAVGGYYGAKLARAGHDVTFVARGAHLQAIRERGLTVKSSLGDFTVHANAAETVERIPPPARAISAYVRPWSRCAYSVARVPANTRCV